MEVCRSGPRLYAQRPFPVGHFLVQSWLQPLPVAAPGPKFQGLTSLQNHVSISGGNIMIHRKQILMLAAALCFAVAPAFGQHSHAGAGGPGGSHGPAMTNAAPHHANPTPPSPSPTRPPT